MSELEFRQIERQLEETLSELKEVRDPQHRRTLLSHMRLLLIEADRLLLKVTPTIPPTSLSRDR
jgi:hypothetical protein